MFNMQAAPRIGRCLTTGEKMVTKAEIKNTYSCKRKSDFVTYFAIFLFLMIIIFELYLTLWMPVQLKKKGTLERHVAKEEMVALADKLREDIDRIELKNSLQEGEVRLAKNILDTYAIYVRENQDNMDMTQIRQVFETFRRYEQLVEGWKARNFLITREMIDMGPMFKELEKKYLQQGAEKKQL